MLSLARLRDGCWWVFWWGPFSCLLVPKGTKNWYPGVFPGPHSNKAITCTTGCLGIRALKTVNRGNRERCRKRRSRALITPTPSASKVMLRTRTSRSSQHQNFFLNSRVSRSVPFSKKKDPRGGRGSYSKLLLFQWPRLEERIKNARITTRGSRRGASFNHMIQKF